MSKRLTIGRLASVLFIAFVLVVLPTLLWQLGMGYYIRLAQLSAIYVILAVSLNLLTGTLGLLTLAQAAFCGVGAYSAALLAVKYEFTFIVTLPLAGLLSGLVAGGISFSIARLSRLFFTVGSLAIGSLIGLILLNWTQLTNGPMGIRSIPGPVLFGWPVPGPIGSYYVCAVVMLFCVFVVDRLTYSSFGTALRAVREDEQAASGMGLRPIRLKLVAISISGGLAGIAGALLAHTTNFISPEMFGLSDSVLILTMAVIGGLGSLPGAMLGAILMTILPELARDFGQFRTTLVGSILFLTILLLPQGLIGEVLWHRLRRRSLASTKSAGNIAPRKHL